MLELEAKYLIAAGMRPKRVLRRVVQELSWAGYRIRPKGEVQVQDRYLETKDWCLHRTGWTYRLRDADGKKTLTLKQLGGGRGALFERREIEQPAQAAEPDHPQPGPVAAQLDELLGSHRRTFNELFVLDNRRSRYQLTHPDYPGDVIELSFDRVRIEATHVVRFSELEFELRHGGSEFLADLLSILREQPNLIAARVGKFQRGLFAAACAPLQRRHDKPVPNADSRWLDVGRRFLAIQLEQLKAHEPFAFEAIHPEGVHQMRVVTRRIRAALDVFAPVLPKMALGKDLRCLARVLGRIRDVDVHLDRLRSYRQDVSFTGRSVLNVYRRRLHARRWKAHQKLITFLESPAYAKLLADYGTLLDQNQYPSSGERSLRVRDASRVFVKPQLKKVLKEGGAITPESPPEALHHLRIEVKRLRYQIEHLVVPGGAIKRAGKSLDKLQQSLGRHRDAWLARNQLNGYRRKRKLVDSESKAFKKLVRLESDAVDRWRERFGENWEEFETNAKRLKKALG
ncbi:MAG: CHAD domain-containing protein [Gammaproteobacteria bacterium]|nr:CHAD domain-containing protein [Gammaproteobacteria bacterium]